MRVESRKERLWSRLVRPLLWPVLIAEFALLALCLVVGLNLWYTLPAQGGWSSLVWLVLALLLGTGLNGAIFLVQLRHRLATHEGSLLELVMEHEAWLAEAGRQAGVETLPGAPPEDPRARITRLLDGMRTLHRRQRQAVAPVADEGGEVLLRQALEGHERDLDRLRVGHQRAREESRLKSDYLVHLRGETTHLVQAMERVQDEIGAGSPSQAVEELRERLADIEVLLGTLAGAASDLDDASPSPATSRPARVLIVDDGPVNLLLARQVLEGQGVSVTTATGGAEALACMERGPPFDLVLMDIFMPDMDGIETSRRWRERESARGGGSPSILVALTANASDEDRRRFRAAGMDDSLAKPYRPRELLGLVRRWLPDRFAHDASRPT